MANFVLPLTLSAALASALTYGAVTNPAPSPKETPFLVSTVATVDHKTWVLKNTRSNKLCVVYKTRRVSSATSQVDIESACTEVFAGSEFVTVWQEDELGNVSFADGRGNILAEFAYDIDTGLISISAEPGSLKLTPKS